ncbi:MAG: guanylate kinase [Actinomycetia bacterium]|nr:guanylate kinase [Actinomycetes bacterium]MCP4958909.1 guanylate kinase [Actinomycetes bacterium]
MPETESPRSLTVVVCGAGGAGKGSIVSALIERDDRLWLSRSWTTRPRRDAEPPDAYAFVSRGEFESRIEQGRFLEWARFFEHLYGTPLPEAPDGCDVVLEIDVQGALQVREVDPGAVVVLVLPPSRDEQRRRMQHRGDDDDHVAKRLAKSDAEEEIGRGLADLILVNDDLDRAVDEIEDLISQHRRGSSNL